MRQARSYTLRFSPVLKSRGLGPWALPPPRRIGLCLSPTRARPVPFCAYSLRCDPATSHRVLDDAVPCRVASPSYTTAWCRIVAPQREEQVLARPRLQRHRLERREREDGQRHALRRHPERRRRCCCRCFCCCCRGHRAGGRREDEPALLFDRKDAWLATVAT